MLCYVWCPFVYAILVLDFKDLGSERTMDYYVRRWDDPDSDSDSDGEGKQESREDVWAYILTKCEKHWLFTMANSL